MSASNNTGTMDILAWLYGVYRFSLILAIQYNGLSRLQDSLGTLLGTLAKLLLWL
jgi:hypothetical protein